jgi:hypothetical protein
LNELLDLNSAINSVTVESKSVKPSCGFYGKNYLESRKLIQGPTTCVCDECVELMVDIIREEVDPKFCLWEV